MKFFWVICCCFILNVLADEKTNEPPITVLFSKLKNFKLQIVDQTYAEKEELPLLVKSIPEDVTKLNGKRIKIAGYMIPLALDAKNKVPLFLLAPDTSSCCFGNVPNLNGFIYCAGTIGFDFKNDLPIEVVGVITTIPYYDKKEDCVLVYKMIPESITQLKAMPKDDAAVPQPNDPATKKP